MQWLFPDRYVRTGSGQVGPSANGHREVTQRQARFGMGRHRRTPSQNLNSQVMHEDRGDTPRGRKHVDMARLYVPAFLSTSIQSGLLGASSVYRIFLLKCRLVLHVESHSYTTSLTSDKVGKARHMSMLPEVRGVGLFNVQTIALLLYLNYRALMVNSSAYFDTASVPFNISPSCTYCPIPYATCNVNTANLHHLI
ncbi:uncharacterized protein CLUP02_16027 [Colletotrichum lupini]|uniref:Uncharacterized protein n=1 Tax=Colletotrichum lupini TaxID=145971 RepID=A0A9Q8T955_9PEZI|nr:uncharacterized protein CLUP02_16027 [Colletotrichum lupini]UQC90497.1 hypothetical protein CLUP02_16027 [Colletotrichum lupini]